MMFSKFCFAVAVIAVIASGSAFAARHVVHKGGKFHERFVGAAANFNDRFGHDIHYYKGRMITVARIPRDAMGVVYEGMGSSVNGGFSQLSYHVGTTTDTEHIWRHGYYQGTDRDQFIRSQLIRDPSNGTR